MKKTILSLFDYSGSWSKPYRDAGYEVIQLDLKLGDDIFEVMQEISYIIADDPEASVYGILAAPPCTDFASSGAAWFRGKETKQADYLNHKTLEFDNTVEHSIGMVLATIAIIEWLKPEFYAIENPVGRIRSLVPELGEPWFFQPYWYGDAYSKKTAIYGKFNKPLKSNNIGLFSNGNSIGCEVNPKWKISKSGKRFSPMHWYTGGNTAKTKEIRSITPPGFAKAFFEANQ